MPILRNTFSVFVILLLGYISVVSANPFESLVMPGKVIEGHKKYESDCSNCHKLFSKRGQDKLCLSCHKKVSKDVKGKRGFHGKSKSIRIAQCKSCHTEHKGRRVDIVKFEKEVFEHNKTDFRLGGRHKPLECHSCHKKNKKYRDAKSSCRSCHLKESPHKKAKAKKDRFKQCSDCHRATGWNKLVFNHTKKTKYKLTGAHKTALCQSCHINQRYKKTPKKCISCHKIDDVHRNKNGSKCNKCHTTKQWGKISFNHVRDTSFRLKGKHKKTPCKSCHSKISFKKKSKKKKRARKCFSCHSYDDKHNGVFGKKCNSCHHEKDWGWDETRFNHAKETKFPLKGKHKKIECDYCHKVSKKKKKLKSKCISCHKSDDVHNGNLGGKCNSCHTSVSWKKRIKFEHDLTHFPLMGMHSAVACEECHTSSGYKKIKKSCVACHKNDDFHKGKLGNNCDRCHTPNDWGVWFFNHNRQSRFKIRNSHKKVHCHSCHNESVIKVARKPRDCQSCHSTDDPHNGQFGSRCNDCHNTKDFSQINMK
ncbi:MAG TPA: cytochrome C [Gammaproteobacteria bacterium]|nr:cytochrome C [Gammaproteobacteria bacterium]